MDNNDNPIGQSLRLNKAIAARGICSRRKADELIFNGKVKLNGKLEKNPAVRVASKDILEVNGKIYSHNQDFEYLIFNKPIECVCTLNDPQGRATIMDYIPEKFKNKRLFPVGRLDYFSEGLLLLTNDGDFAQLMAHPSNHKTKVYEVIVREKVLPEYIKQMEKGMVINDCTLQSVKVKIKILKNGLSMMTMELSQGINRQIRKMCAKFNLTILSLRRIKIADLELGNLKAGEMRTLTSKEKENLISPKIR